MCGDNCMITGTYKELNMWVVTFIDWNGKKQETIDASFTKAVQMAMVNRCTSL
jgi:hypothetical protein